MSNNPPTSIPSQNRLYKGLITTLKTLQFVGYLFVALYSLIIAGFTGLFGEFAGFLGLISLIIGCISVYVTTQVLIAIIDLLSRIEENTR